MLVAGGATNITTYFALRLAADGTAATGLTITNIDLQYVRSGAAPSTKVDATALAATDSAHGDNQAIEIDATDAPGLYRVDWPDAAFAAGVREVILSVKVATAFTEHLRVTIDGEVNVVEWAGTDVVAGAIPAAAADAAGGLPISDGGGLDMDAILVDTNSLNDTKIPNTLNTTAAGNIGIDWANVENPTTALDLSATDIQLVDTCTTNSDMVAEAPTAAANADAVWDELLSGHVIAGSSGEALAAAGAAGDPWITALPGSYTAGQAGKIVGDNINAPIDLVQTAADAIKAVTDNLPDSGALTTIDTQIGAIQTTLDDGTDGLAAINTAIGIIDGLVDTLILRVPDTLSLSNIKTQTESVMDTTARPEITALPAANATIVDKINWLFTLCRNKGTQTSTLGTIRNDDDTADIATTVISDDTTTFNRNEWT